MLETARNGNFWAFQVVLPLKFLWVWTMVLVSPKAGVGRLGGPNSPDLQYK